MQCQGLPPTADARLNVNSYHHQGHNLLVRIHFIIVMIRWTGLAPWEIGFHFPRPASDRGRAPQCQQLPPPRCSLATALG